MGMVQTVIWLNGGQYIGLLTYAFSLKARRSSQQVVKSVIYRCGHLLTMAAIVSDCGYRCIRPYKPFAFILEDEEINHGWNTDFTDHAD
jgi:hypothetical protein